MYPYHLQNHHPIPYEVEDAGRFTVAEYGEDRIWVMTEQILADHNSSIKDLVLKYCNPNNYAQIQYERQYIEIPLQAWSMQVQWTKQFLQKIMVDTFHNHLQDLLRRDRNTVLNAIKDAFFMPFNNPARAQYALLNGDGGGPRGFEDDNHYLISHGLEQEDLVRLILAVTEHIDSSETNVTMLCSSSLYGRIKQLLAYSYLGGINQFIGTPTTELVGMTMRGQFVHIGLENAPWIPDKYILCMRGIPSRDRDIVVRPLAYRWDQNEPYKADLHLLAEHEYYPLRSQAARRYFGVGVQVRHAAACLYVDDDAKYDAYVVPCSPMNS